MNTTPSLKPIRPMVDLLNSGVFGASVLHYGNRYPDNVDYLSLVKPNTMSTGCDMTKAMPRKKFDTVFSCYDINPLRSDAEIGKMLADLWSTTKVGGKIILVAHSVAVVKGMIKRATGWLPLNGGWYREEDDRFIKGYDTVELNAMLRARGMEIITDEYVMPNTPYNYVIAEKVGKIVYR